MLYTPRPIRTAFSLGPVIVGLALAAAGLWLAGWLGLEVVAGISSAVGRYLGALGGR